MENVINNLLYAAPVLAVLALVFAFVKASSVSKQDAGTDRMKEIASAISEGARAFLFAEYKILCTDLCRLSYRQTCCGR